MTKRERNIAIGVGVSMGVLVLNYMIITPLWDSRQKLTDDILLARADLKKDRDLINRRGALDAQWKEIIARGMVYDASTAQAQVSGMLNQFAANSGLRFGALTPDTNASTVSKPGGKPGEKEKSFLRVASRFTGEGGLNQIGEFIWNIKNSPIPMRINELSVSSKSETQNSQEVRMTVSTIFLAPDNIKPGDMVVQPSSRPANAALQAGGTTRPATSMSVAPTTVPIPPANAAAIEEQMRQRRLQQQQGGQPTAAATPASAPTTRTGGQQ